MNEIFITQEMIDTEQSIPLECMPNRADSATTLLAYLKRDKEEGLLVLNYSPDAWKTWSPVYDPVNKFIMNYEFKATNYKQLIEEYEQLFSKQGNTQSYRKQATASYFRSLYGLNNVTIHDHKIEPQYWLKYSKTQNKWTLYRFEFYIVKDTEPSLDLTMQTKMIQDILPLGSDYSNFRGMPLVENVVKVLEDEGVIKALIKNKISLK